jgi:TolB-like protein/tetratricopeptide (TPR) repeat protein
MSKLILAALLALTAAGAAAAQCADGTPPPCDSRRSVQMAVVPKRVNPPLNDRTYIVLPFNNVTRAPDSEWLSDGSVGLLSTSLSGWKDIHVIDDRRVADFMREVPRPTAGKLSFNDGVAVARRAGAGRMVIGDVLKVGSRITVTTTLFDVRSGRQIRSVREETTVADSLMSMFGKLARGILAVPATDASAGTMGTSRADALKEYVTGVQALNKFDATTAKKHFEEALRLDTAFALAHYKWAIAATYDERAGTARSAQVKVGDLASMARMMEDFDRIAHAKAASRLSASLPAREQKLIAGMLALATHDYPRACDAYGPLVAADSSDVEALYGYGQCIMLDDVVEPVPGDSTRLRFRSNWNTAVRVFRRAVVTDPTFHLAFDPLVTILTAPLRAGCIRKDVTQLCSDTSNHSWYVGDVTRVGDSLVVAAPRGPLRSVVSIMVESNQKTPPRANVEAARDAALDWAAAGPTEGRPHKHLGRLLLRLGRPAEAERHVKEAMLDPSLAGDREIFLHRIEIATKLFRGREVNRLMDSLGGVFPGELGAAAYAGLAPLTGRMKSLDSMFTSLFAKSPQSPSRLLVDMTNQIPRLASGVILDTLLAMERMTLAALPAGAVCGGQCLSSVAAGYMLGLRAPRTWPPLPPEIARERRLLPALALSKGDTVQLRAAARLLDSVSRHNARMSLPEDGSSAIGADAFLILGDTLAALAAARRMLDSTLSATPLDGLIGIGPTTTTYLWPRALLLRADLEAAAGSQAVARDLYDKFLELWAKPDPEFAPLIARVKAARAKLR